MKKIFLVCLIGLIAWACSEGEEPEVNQDSFDRSAMLANWADNIIVPAYEDYTGKLDELSRAKDNFLSTVSTENLLALRSSWTEAYIAWQKVSMFEIGKAEELTLRDFTNIFPTNAEEIESNISSEDYNLELPSTRAQQGFPALDYLINGSAKNDASITTRFSKSQLMRSYLNILVERLNNLASSVLDDWKNGYRATFVEKSGSNASSSVNKLMNDFMFYYEKSLRAGKIGIPAGVFSNDPLSDKVEAFYKKDISKTLFETGLQASADFFNGVHFDGEGQGEGIKSYLDFVNSISEGENLSNLVNSGFSKALKKSDNLSENFYNEVETNNQAMLETYDALQVNVILIKTDVFQALNVKVDYVDADGD